MFDYGLLVPLFGIVFSLGIPVVAIISAVIMKVKKSNNDREIRRLIVENHTDLDTAKYLVEESEKKQGSNPYPALRWGCVLIGVGLGALLDFLLHITPRGDNMIYFWVLIAFGCGLGLLCSFLVEYRLQRRDGLNSPHEEG